MSDHGAHERPPRLRALRSQLPSGGCASQGAGVCDSCGGKLIQRHDDEPETVKHRLEVYHKETEPLKDFYAERGLLRSVENQPSVEATTKAILNALGR